MIPAGPLALLLLLAPAPEGPASYAQSYDCANTTCKQIRSCEEACYKLCVCGHKARDRDHDGIPCENLCGARRCGC